MSSPVEEVTVDPRADQGLSEPSVVTKYKAAAEIANNALTVVLAAIKPGVSILSLCETGDAFILAETAKIFNKGKVEKGISFPTSISVNNVCGHFSPLAGYEGVLATGDVVKVDLGAYIDGYAAVVAHSVVVQEAAAVVEGRVADLMHAAHFSMEAALRTLKPGKTNAELTKVYESVAAAFKVNLVGGVLSHTINRYVIDGEKMIISREDPESQIKPCTFETGDVFVLDVVFSSGEGKPREMDDKVTIYKRAVDVRYKPKLKAANYALREINTNFHAFPFSVRHMEDPTKGRLGLKELYGHGMVEGYPVLLEKTGDVTVHVKATVLMLPSGPTRITGKEFDLTKYAASTEIVDESLLALLAEPIKVPGKNKKKKKKAAKAAQ